MRELFLRAHTIDDLALTIPPAASATLRVLAVIAARLTTTPGGPGLDDPELSAEQWTARRQELLHHPQGFDPKTVHAYFNAHPLDLLHPTRPFLQDPALADQCPTTSGINTLVFGRPAGNNLAWLSPHTDTDPQPVPCDEALWHLLAQHYYGPAGSCTPRTVAGQTSGTGTAGPLRSTISFHPLGRTLYETLLLNAPKYTGDWPDLPDTCPWEEPQAPDPQAPQHPLTWPGRLLTGRSRHAILLIPTSDGHAIADAYLTWATQQPKLEATDPYLIIHTDPKKPIQQRRTPRRADADRAVWRDLDALLLAGDESATVQRPQIFDTLNDLPTDVRAALRVRACGFDQDGKTRNRTWYTVLTPPIWTWSQENDPAMARRIALCRAAAEEVAARLAALAARAWQEAVTPPHGSRPRSHKVPKRVGPWVTASHTAYWPRAEATFWRLLNEDPDQPARAAFAADAVTVLREVTAPAIVQYRRAAPAVVRAVAALRAGPAPAGGRGRPRRQKAS